MKIVVRKKSKMNWRKTANEKTDCNNASGNSAKYDRLCRQQEI